MKAWLDRDTVVATAGDLVCMPTGVTTQMTGLGPIVAIYVEIADTPAWTPLKTRGPSIRQYESSQRAYALVDSISPAQYRTQPAGQRLRALSPNRNQTFEL